MAPQFALQPPTAQVRAVATATHRMDETQVQPKRDKPHRFGQVSENKHQSKGSQVASGCQLVFHWRVDSRYRYRIQQGKSCNPPLQTEILPNQSYALALIAFFTER